MITPRFFGWLDRRGGHDWPGRRIFIVVWQYSANKRVMYLETGATFIGMLNPYAGMAANILVGAYRTSEARTAEYRNFSQVELKKNVNLMAHQMVDLWGQSKKDENCIASAKIEAHCVEIRPTLPAYSGSNCARSVLDRDR